MEDFTVTVPSDIFQKMVDGIPLTAPPMAVALPSAPHDLFTDFFHSVMEHLSSLPNGCGFIAKLGVDRRVKQAWAALNMSKAKKMANILDTRPDLFSRFMTERNQPMVRLLDKAWECMPPNSIPPMDAATVATMSTASTCAMVESAAAARMAAPVAVPLLPMRPREARLFFLKVALSAIASLPGASIDLSQLGGRVDVQQTWKATGLDKKLKMSEMIKERPDLFLVGVNQKNMNMTITLTELGLNCAQTENVAEPDASCPTPTQPKYNAYWQSQLANKGKGKGSYQGSRYSPYPSANATPLGGMQQQANATPMGGMQQQALGGLLLRGNLASPALLGLLGAQPVAQGGAPFTSIPSVAPRQQYAAPVPPGVYSYPPL